jgi:hypothetical protein
MSNAVMTEAQRAYDRVLEHMERIRNDQDVSMQNLEVGDQWIQGDVRIIRLPDDFVQQNAKMLTRIENFDGKLAVGNTLGSRHYLTELQNLQAYRLNEGNVLDGPIVQINKPGSMVDHPEHGNCCDLPVGCYAFPGQRAFAEELKRTRD